MGKHNDTTCLILKLKCQADKTTWPGCSLLLFRYNGSCFARQVSSPASCKDACPRRREGHETVLVSDPGHSVRRQQKLQDHGQRSMCHLVCLFTSHLPNCVAWCQSQHGWRILPNVLTASWLRIESRKRKRKSTVPLCYCTILSRAVMK